MQNPSAICNATVSIKDVNGSWSEIGTLDKGTNTFDVNKTILEVKLTSMQEIQHQLFMKLLQDKEQKL